MYEATAWSCIKGGVEMNGDLSDLRLQGFGNMERTSVR